MDGILNNIVSLVRTPPMFIAIIAMLGLVLQKKGIICCGSGKTV